MGQTDANGPLWTELSYTYEGHADCPRLILSDEAAWSIVPDGSNAQKDHPQRRRLVILRRTGRQGMKRGVTTLNDRYDREGRLHIFRSIATVAIGT